MIESFTFVVKQAKKSVDSVVFARKKLELNGPFPCVGGGRSEICFPFFGFHKKELRSAQKTTVLREDIFDIKVRGKR